jgi:hypothetical protein
LPGSPWDWDPNYYKAECPANYYVSGVAQYQTGQLTKSFAGSRGEILCCPYPQSFTISQTSCSLQVFAGRNSRAFQVPYSLGLQPDWDNGYFKGQCPSGQLAAGVSALGGQGPQPPGAPHGLLCCPP